MASVTLTHEVQTEAEPVDSSAPRAWWRCGHSYAFVAVVALEIGATWCVVRVGEWVVNYMMALDYLAAAAMLGFVFAKCFLLGLWAALGGLGTVPRWLLAGIVSTLGGLAIASQLVNGQWLDFLYHGPMMAVLAGLTAAGFAVVLVPLRRLAGWRVDFLAAYHPGTGRRRGQLDMMDFAAMFCAVSLPLALGRSLVELMGDEAADIGVIVPIIGAIVLTTAGPVAYATLAPCRFWLGVLTCTVWLVLLGTGQSILMVRFPDLDIFDASSGAWGVGASVVAFQGGVAVSVVLPLAALRFWGLKLLVVSEQDCK
jgi:hypothetical protein